MAAHHHQTGDDDHGRADQHRGVRPVAEHQPSEQDNEASIRLMLDHLGLAHHIAFVTGYDSGHGVKPGPGMALAFAEAIGLEPSEIAVVGDNSHDIDMGRSAGAGLVIGVLSGTGDKATLEPIADVCLTDIGELPAFLAAHTAN